MAKTYQNFIGGQWVDSGTRETYPSINPANTKEVLGYFQSSSVDDVKTAIEAASIAFPSWANTSAPIRGDVLFRLIQALENERNNLATIITKEVGKSLREARGEVEKTIQAMKQFSGEATRLTGETIPSYDAEIFGYTVREPLGVVGVIAPYNFPLGIGIWKIAPAIVAGNTVVFKPASNTSLISIKIIELFEKSGVPKGVINMVTGSGSVVGREFGENQALKAVSFTGSSEVGIALGKAVTARGGKMQAEMGGKNPSIILEDADINQAVDSLIDSSFLDNGQRCTGTSRLIIPKTIKRVVIDKLIEKTKKLVIGNGFDEGVDNGPVIDESQLNVYLHYVKSALEEGATLEYGGKRLTENGLDKGYFVAPTIFSGVTEEMTIAKEEIFGPVVAVMEVDSYEEAMRVANNTEFGLSSTIYTKDLNKAFHFVRNIQSGVTHVNIPSNYFENQYPFGGKKTSSIGPREQGSTALDFWTDYKTVYVRP
ncbi:aldehyde dehydrogenase family protein [Aquibacillus sp. 3ASR75-11]|uniref:Aldehyde dehydrogenase family protein n=1 Tax=Terrihalobacillus insolitus TaxID=2950438 RepID=A0A9X3WQI9_9BACI|nr:aldehyde dehydrogenase family protein [Terrihalobacillus insolitus]MDC3411908.1 aldehyde dehydrogenase family protein [Terrihalobacillus insolitus]MDC3423405.1 aldehyde dehydrogenase family protein [Terrihalobacillus insolitus]